MGVAVVIRVMAVLFPLPEHVLTDRMNRALYQRDGVRCPVSLSRWHGLLLLLPGNKQFGKIPVPAKKMNAGKPLPGEAFELFGDQGH